MGKRNLFLDIKPVDEALSVYKEKLEGLVSKKYEEISVTDSLGRITKEAIYAKQCSPLYNSSAMDGIAVISEKTEGATEVNPKEIREIKDYVVADTGDPIHTPYDAVIMAEELIDESEGEGNSGGTVKIIEAATPWQHIRPIGEDIVQGEMILSSNHKVRPIDIGVLLSAGILKIEVVKKPTVAIFPTGTEIIEPGAQIEGGSIIESNSRMFENMVTEDGGVGIRFAPIKDEYEKIKEAVRQAAEKYDMVIINAGSSAGRDDYTVHVLRDIGEVFVHGVAIKPGKPVILAAVKGVPVIGLPGYPVSAHIGFENFVTPIIEMFLGRKRKKENLVDAFVSRRLVSSLKHKEYVRVKVGQVGTKLVAAPLARGAGAAMSLVRADGVCVIPQNSEGVEAGEKVGVELYRELENLKNTLMIIGSHDLILDIVADIMPNKFLEKFVSSTHVGSMAGLMALKREEAHMAPIHLINPETGQYNIDIVKSIFSEPMAIIKGVGRQQGLLVKKGNPLEIKSIEDIAKKKARFVNRQRGAGTRELFDYRLKTLGISPEEIKGYKREGATHMTVAAAVASDSADVAMGIYSAAQSMNLDFVKIAEEEYDFAVPVKFLEEEIVNNFIQILKSEDFHQKITSLGGYQLDKAGEVVLI